MRLFLAGIMQGSHRAACLHEQGYRPRLKALLRRHFPTWDIYDPLEDHEHSLDYDDEHARGVFLHHNRLCQDVDVVLAYLPEASMGTSIEMWEAYQHGRAVIAISPLTHNWVVKFLAHAVYADLEHFEAAVLAGEFAQRLNDLVGSHAAPRPPIRHLG